MTKKERGKRKQCLLFIEGAFLSASFYLHFIYLTKQHKCNAFPKQTKVEKGMDRYRALTLLTCGRRSCLGPLVRYNANRQAKRTLTSDILEG